MTVPVLARPDDIFRPRSTSGRSIVAMSTVVRMSVVTADDDPRNEEREAAFDRACDWFRYVERVCSRFVDDSDVARLARSVGEPVVVSRLLLEAVGFALAVAHDTNGAFDPTIGAAMAKRGFDVSYTHGRPVGWTVDQSIGTSYRDVVVDHDAGTIALRRPLMLDLGAVAKGLAIDMAARELSAFADFAIDAGGDLRLAGRNAEGEPWSVGIRHPRRPGEFLETLRISDCAVCTSGGYERRAPDGVGHHILDPRSGVSPDALSSVTVIASTAMVADALATAAFVLGPVDGLAFLERHAVDAILYASSLERSTSSRWVR